jgi:predicted RNA-binding protein YlqC (UPF0109 family)
MASETTTHNFKFALHDTKSISLLVGKGGSHLINKIIKPSIQDFTKLKDSTHQEVIDKVKSGEIKIKTLKIKFNCQDDVAEPYPYATWNDIEELGGANVLLIKCIQEKITECAKSVDKFVKMKKKAVKKEKKEEPEKVYRQNFYFRMNVDEDLEIGRFIGNGGEIINAFRKKIADTLKVEKVYVNIDDFDKDVFMYRVIGDVISDDSDLIFKVSYLGGTREDIIKIEKMIIDFVKENSDEDDYDYDDYDDDDDDDKDDDQTPDDDGVDHKAGGW